MCQFMCHISIPMLCLHSCPLCLDSYPLHRQAHVKVGVWQARSSIYVQPHVSTSFRAYSGILCVCVCVCVLCELRSSSSSAFIPSVAPPHSSLALSLSFLLSLFPLSPPQHILHTLIRVTTAGNNSSGPTMRGAQPQAAMSTPVVIQPFIQRPSQPARESTPADNPFHLSLFAH